MIRGDRRSRACYAPVMLDCFYRISGILKPGLSALALCCALFQTSACMRSDDCAPSDPICSPLGLGLYAFGGSWHTYLGGAGNEQGRALLAMPDGGALIVGNASESFGFPLTAYNGGTSDMLLARFNASGAPLWHFFVGGAGDEFAASIAPTSDGGFVVLGAASASFGAPLNAHSGGQDFVILRYGADGALLWQTFLGASSNSGTKIIQTSDGGFLFCGIATATFGAPIVAFAGSGDIALVKLSAAGALEWNTFLGGGGVSSSPTDLVLLPDGGSALAGSASGTFGAPIVPHAGMQDGLAARFDASGNLQWLTFFGSAQDDFSGGLAATLDGGLVITGAANAGFGAPLSPFTDSLERDLTLLKLNASGFLEWNTFAGGPTSREIGRGILTNPDGSFAVLATGDPDSGGTAGGFGFPLRPFSPGDGSDILLLGFSASGLLQWHTYIGGGGSAEINNSADDRGQAFASAPAIDGGYLIAGRGRSGFGSPRVEYAGPSPGTDLLLVKTGASGFFL